MRLPKITVILGPTASGKSTLAVKIALKKNGEIISADSRQVYKGLNIGSGKITKEEMMGVPHHLLDIVSPNKIFTAYDYSIYAKSAICDIISRKKMPIICGGTGFYIDAILYGAFTNVPIKKSIRDELNKYDTLELSKKLSNLDPRRFAEIDIQNRRRLIRALEIILLTGKPIEKINKENKYDSEKIGILWPKEELYKRIEIRLNERLANGMIEEVYNLKYPKKGNGLTFKRLYDLGLEYKYISLYLKKEIDYALMHKSLLTAIKQYAKRQMTWFKKDKEINWISPSDLENIY